MTTSLRKILPRYLTTGGKRRVYPIATCVSCIFLVIVYDELNIYKYLPTTSINRTAY